MNFRGQRIAGLFFRDYLLVRTRGNMLQYYFSNYMAGKILEVVPIVQIIMRMCPLCGHMHKFKAAPFSMAHGQYDSGI